MAAIGRPKVHDDRVSLSVRLPRELHQQLRAEAEHRVVSVNLLVVKAIQAYLPLIPALDA